MKTYTDIKTLKRVWTLLKEMGLENLLSGERVDLDLVKTLDSLLDNGKLNEFCQMITHTEQEFEEMELKEVSEVIGDFFTAISESLNGLTGKMQVKASKTAN